MRTLPTIPSIPMPFASESSAKRITIPTTDQSDAVSMMMSWNLGFPQAFSRSIANGGRYVQRSDFNTIFNLITTALQYLFAGGEVDYNESFQRAIGGYPEGAVVHVRRSGQRADKRIVLRDEHWRSTRNDNGSRPGTNNDWELLDAYVSTSDMSKWVGNTNAVEAWAIKEAIEASNRFGPPNTNNPTTAITSLPGSFTAPDDGWLYGSCNGCKVTVNNVIVYQEGIGGFVGYICLPIAKGSPVNAESYTSTTAGQTEHSIALSFAPYKKMSN